MSHHGHRSFGKPGGQFDFDAVNIPQAKEKARELEETQKGMKKKINPKVMNMIDVCVPSNEIRPQRADFFMKCGKEGGGLEEEPFYRPQGQDQD